MKFVRDAHNAIALAASIKPLLAGQEPGIVGAVLVELVATHLAGHRLPRHDQLKLLDLHARTVKAMIPVIERELGLPPLPTWEGST